MPEEHTKKWFPYQNAGDIKMTEKLSMEKHEKKRNHAD
jgi:hypothetical protein